jgi:ADP-ribosylation factor GTPase-activating protein 1
MSEEERAKELKFAANQRCVDCGEASPRWCSMSFGIFICLNCAGHHRSFGSHITVVKSLELDELQPSYYVVLQIGGNQSFLEYLYSLNISFPESLLSFIENPPSKSSNSSSPLWQRSDAFSSPPSPLGSTKVRKYKNPLVLYYR